MPQQFQFLSKKLKTGIQRYLHVSVHCSIIHNNHKVENTVNPSTWLFLVTFSFPLAKWFHDFIDVNVELMYMSVHGNSCCEGAYIGFITDLCHK